VKPPTIADLVWERDLILSGQSGDARITIDSDGKAGPSPVQALAFAMAGCMAIDVVHILRKGRHPLAGLRARITGERAQEDPHRFVRIQLDFTLEGAIPGDAVERAVVLSREKYCSVWHSMRQDIELEVTVEVVPAEH
jgi:putative redox protein